MSRSDTIEKDLCAAYREGCQKIITSKLDTITEKVGAIALKTDVQSTAIMALTSKITVLELNEIPHLRTHLDTIQKTRRDPLGWKEKIALIGIGATAATAILVEVIRGLL